jgi:hypothetical protein
MIYTAIAYTHYDLFELNAMTTKYLHYKNTLVKVREFGDDPNFRRFYGIPGSTDCFTHFFADLNTEAVQFEEMIETIETGGIDRVFILVHHNELNPELLGRLVRMCDVMNIELMIPPSRIDNIAHKELFESFV